MNKSMIAGTVHQPLNIKNLSDEDKIVNYKLKVKRKNNSDKFDIINVTAFNKEATWAEENLSVGTFVIVTGHLQNNNYRNGNNEKVYTTEIVVESQELSDE